MSDEKPNVADDLMEEEATENAADDLMEEMEEEAVEEATAEATDAAEDIIELTDIERSAIGEICDLIGASLAKAFGDKLGAGVGMDPSSVEMIGFDDLGQSLQIPILLIQLSSSSALEGQFFIFIGGDGLPKIFDLAIPEEAKEIGADDELILEGIKEITEAAVSEAMTNFAESMGHRIDCTVVDSLVLQDETGFESLGFMYPEGRLLNVSTTLALPDGMVNAGFLLPVNVGSQIIELLLNDQLVPESDSSSYTDAEDESDFSEVSEDNSWSGGADLASEAEEAPQVQDMQLAKFGSISGEINESGDKSNISLLLDVPLDAAIELGKTQMTIEEILRLTKGSVIELDKLASEPVEFLVNGKVIARGEVVVIDDNFGIRITEILSPRARLESL